jgi:hypothetical protein
MGPYVGVARESIGPTSKHGRASDVVPAQRVGQAHSKLRQPLPQVAFGFRG